jgi:hypothetical protein
MVKNSPEIGDTGTMVYEEYRRVKINNTLKYQ